MVEAVHAKLESPIPEIFEQRIRNRISFRNKIKGRAKTFLHLDFRQAVNPVMPFLGVDVMG